MFFFWGKFLYLRCWFSPPFSPLFRPAASVWLLLALLSLPADLIFLLSPLSPFAPFSGSILVFPSSSESHSSAWISLVLSICWHFISTIGYFISKVTDSFFHNSLVLPHVLNTHFLGTMNYTYSKSASESLYCLSVSSVCFLLSLVFMHLRCLVIPWFLFAVFFCWQPRDCGECRGAGTCSPVGYLRSCSASLIAPHPLHVGGSVSHERGDPTPKENWQSFGFQRARVLVVNPYQATCGNHVSQAGLSCSSLSLA